MATTTADDTHDEPAEERQPSLLASFSRADLRLLLVTFAGTVAANVVTVMVVAIAIILARPRVVGAPPTVNVVLAFLVSAVSALGFLPFLILYFRDKRAKGKISPREDVLIVVLLMLMGLLGTLALLTLLGWAVGVK